MSEWYRAFWFLTSACNYLGSTVISPKTDHSSQTETEAMGVGNILRLGTDLFRQCHKTCALEIILMPPLKDCSENGA